MFAAVIANGRHLPDVAHVIDPRVTGDFGHSIGHGIGVRRDQALSVQSGYCGANKIARPGKLPQRLIELGIGGGCRCFTE